jgi:hypothetical protein
MKRLLKLSQARKDAVERSMLLMLVSAYQVSSWRWERLNPGETYNTSRPYLDSRTTDYGEAYGMIRALEVLGYGYSGAVNVEDGRNLRPWFESLVDRAEQEVIDCGGVDEAMNKWRRIVQESGDYGEYDGAR